MKDVLSLATFAAVLMCFVIFITALKPAAIMPVRAANTSDLCRSDALARRGCGLRVFADVRAAVLGVAH